MSRFFLLLILGLCVPYIASEFSKYVLNTGIHDRSGYGYGDEGSSSSSVSESSEETESTSEESSSESKSCEKRESCEDPSDKSGLYISNGAVNAKDDKLKPLSTICDCETGSRQFFAPVKSTTTTIKKAFEAKELSYALDSGDAACPKLCIRDDQNHFWVPTKASVALIVSNCVGDYCYNDMGLKSGGELKRVDDETKTFTSSTANIETVTIGSSGTYMKVEAISCHGCDWISKEETSKCFARAE